MKNIKHFFFMLAVSVLAASCGKNAGSDNLPAPVMNPSYFLPAYVTAATAPTARNNVAITTSMPDAIYYTNSYPATGVIFTVKDQTGAILTTLTGVPQGTVFQPSQYYIVNLPSSFTVPAAWVGKTVTITASNSSTPFTMYRII